MSSLQELRRFVDGHRMQLTQAAEDPDAFDRELRNLEEYWDQDDDDQAKLDQTWRSLRPHPRVVALLAQAGLSDPAKAQDGAGRRTSAAPATPPAADRASAAVKAPPPAEGPSPWDRKLGVGKEIVTGVLAVLIVIVTLVVAVIATLYPGDDAARAAAKDGLLFLNGLVGVVLGYYFGRAPGDARADRADDQAQQAKSQRDQTLGEIRGVLDSGGVSLDRGERDGVMLTPQQVARLRELVR
jgi:hypothetical protein